MTAASAAAASAGVARELLRCCADGCDSNLKFGDGGAPARRALPVVRCSMAVLVGVYIILNIRTTWNNYLGLSFFFSLFLLLLFFYHLQQYCTVGSS